MRIVRKSIFLIEAIFSFLTAKWFSFPQVMLLSLKSFFTVKAFAQRKSKVCAKMIKLLFLVEKVTF